MNLNYRTASVYGIYGSLGGGKSLTAVDIMIGFLARGDPVYSNIQLYNLPKCYDGQFHYFDAEGFDYTTLPYGDPRGSKGKKRVCIVVDECAEYLDQFTSTSEYTKRFCSWLRHTSKNGQFVFLIVQSPDFLVKSVRLIVANWICCVDLAQFVLPIARLKIPFCGNLVWRRVFDRRWNLISRGWDTVDKRWFGQYYKTSALVAHTLAANDDSDLPPPIPSVWQLYGWVMWIFIILDLYFMLYFNA